MCVAIGLIITIILILNISYVEYQFCKYNEKAKKVKINDLDLRQGDIILYRSSTIENKEKCDEKLIGTLTNCMVNTTLYFVNRHITHMAIVIKINGILYISHAYGPWAGYNYRDDSYNKSGVYLQTVNELLNYSGTIYHMKCKETIHNDMGYLLPLFDKLKFNSNIWKTAYLNWGKKCKYKNYDVVCSDFLNIILYEMGLMSNISRQCDINDILGQCGKFYTDAKLISIPP